MNIDLDVIIKNDELFKLELADLEKNYIAENKLGELTKEQQEELNGLKALESEKHRINRIYTLTKAIESAFKKYNNDVDKVREFFRSKGLERDFEIITNTDPGK